MAVAWADAELLAALQAVAEDVDGPLSSFAYGRLRARGLPGASSIVEHFGTWAAALVAAGLERDAIVRERFFHELLEAADHDRSRARAGGTE